MRFSRIIKPLLIGLVLFFLFYLFVSILLTDRPKPKGMTQTTMFFTHRRILIYAAKNGRPPESLDDLPDMPGFDNSLLDGWGRKIGYKIVDGDVAELTSLGKDGGTGGESVIVRRFALHDANGNWNDPLSDWLPDDTGKGIQ